MENEKIMLFGEYFIVGLQKTRELFLKEAREVYNNEWGEEGEIKEELIKIGYVADHEDYGTKLLTQKENTKIFSDTSIKEYKRCFYINAEDIEDSTQ